MAKSPAERLNAAVALHQAGRLPEAARLYQEILARWPRHPEALHLLGLLRIATGELESGTALIRRAIAARPDEALFHANLGLAFLRAERYAEAIGLLRRAIALDPGPVEPHDQLGGALALSGDLAGAVAALRQAALRFPRDPRFPARISGLLLQSGDGAAARAAAETTLALAPRHPDALVNLGLVEVAAGDSAAALVHFDAALSAAPMHIAAQNNFAYAAGQLADFARQERVARLIERRIVGGAVGDTWATLADIAYLCPYLNLPIAVQGRVLDELAARFPAVTPLPPSPLPGSLGRRRPLRIGYVSTGFGNYAISHVTRSLFAAHDRASFRVYGYSIVDRSGDDTGYYQAVRAGFDEWRNLTELDDDAAAAAIRADEIDVLVDICGYLEGRRPGIFARRPAPVQAYWLAHAGGLGLKFIDYLIADRVVVPPGEERLYREKIVRLPETYHPADPYPIDPAPPSAAAEGLAGATFVFCAFNNPQKIDRTVFAAWLRILAAVPGSVLWLSDPYGRAAMRDNLRRAAEAGGIAGERIVFAAVLREKGRHLARHRLAGLFLDTATINAATTALDALWAGLPVLTLQGDRFARRMAHTMVNALGLADALVAGDIADYESRAIGLARSPPALGALRARLQDALVGKPLFDSARFCRHMERAFAAMAERRERGLPAAAFDVEPI